MICKRCYYKTIANIETAKNSTATGDLTVDGTWTKISNPSQTQKSAKVGNWWRTCLRDIGDNTLSVQSSLSLPTTTGQEH